jgi:hypothetical protein
MQVQAAAFQEVGISQDGDAPIKNGNYYVKYDSSTSKVLISTSEDGPYQETPMVYGAFGNGKIAYYCRNNVLYSYTYGSGKETKLYKLKASGDDGFWVSAVYGNQVFLSKSSFDQWRFWTYRYNIKTGKVKKLRNDCNITAQSGAYAISMDEYRTDVSPYPLTVYKMTKTGLKKVKTLTNYGRSEQFYNGILYYTVYPKGTMKKATLYSYNPKNGKKKKIATFKADVEDKYGYGEVYVLKATDKYCEVYQVATGTNYRYTYATKKMTKID